MYILAFSVLLYVFVMLSSLFSDDVAYLFCPQVYVLFSIRLIAPLKMGIGENTTDRF